MEIAKDAYLGREKRETFPFLSVVAGLWQILAPTNTMVWLSPLHRRRSQCIICRPLFGSFSPTWPPHLVWLWCITRWVGGSWHNKMGDWTTSNTTGTLCFWRAMKTVRQNIWWSLHRVRVSFPKIHSTGGWWWTRIEVNLFSGGAVITNPPLNQNKTEGDLVNFSCEGEVT